MQSKEVIHVTGKTSPEDDSTL